MARFSANGTLFKRGDGGGPENFATVGQVRQIGGPNSQLETLDVTAHGDTVRHFLANLLNAGQVTLDVLMDPADVAGDGLRADHFNRAKRNFQLVFPTSPNKTWSFSGFVTAFQPTANYDAELSCSVTVDITDAMPVIT